MTFQTAEHSETFESAIEEIRKMLRPDGYDLAWKQLGDATVELTVLEGEAPCPECLVPKAIMMQIVQRVLDPAGVVVEEIVYPRLEHH